MRTTQGYVVVGGGVNPYTVCKAMIVSSLPLSSSSPISSSLPPSLPPPPSLHEEPSVTPSHITVTHITRDMHNPSGDNDDEDFLEPTERPDTSKYS